MKKIITAVALTAALTLGAAPAFAVDPAPAGTPITGNKGETTVSVTTTANNISATLPITMTVEGPANGGNLTGVPDNYKLINTSTYPIHVSAIVGAEQPGWKILAGPLSDKSVPTGTTGDIAMKLTPPVAATDATAWTMTTVSAAPTKWNIPTKTGTETNNEFLMTIAGSISPVKEVVSTNPAVKISFTVAPGSAKVTP